MPSVRHPEPFSAVLLSSPPSTVSLEQKKYIKDVLDIACADSKFSEKAYIAISRILAGQTSPPPVVTSLVPNTAELGEASFTLHVHGTGFKSGSIIIFNGSEEVTTFVSATELTTGVDMSTATTAIVVPVAVLSDGIQTDAMMFEFTDGTPAVLSVPKTPVIKTPTPAPTPPIVSPSTVEHKTPEKK